MRKFVGLLLVVLLIAGCSSRGEEDATQKVIDYGTGKKQVDSYQQLKTQIKTIRKEEERQFDEATK